MLVNKAFAIYGDNIAHIYVAILKPCTSEHLCDNLKAFLNKDIKWFSMFALSRVVDLF